MIKLKSIAIISLCLLMVGAINAQEEVSETKEKTGLFVRVNGGYGFEGIHMVQGADLSLESATNIYGSSAPGFNIGLGVGYMFNKYIGLDLGVYYTFGKSKLSEVRQEGLPLELVGAGNQIFSILDANIFQRYTHRSKQWRLNPAVIVRAGDGKIAPYAKVGLVIPIAGRTYTDVEGTLRTSEIPTSIAGFPIPGFDSGVSLKGDVEAEAESFGKFSVGFDASLGLDVRVTDMISIFGEVNMTALTILSKETKVKRYDGVYYLDGSPLTLDDLADGINTVIDLINIGGLGIEDFNYDALGLYESIDDVPLSESHIIYLDALDSTTNQESGAYGNSFDPDQPANELARRDNFSSIGINIGVKFNF